MEWISVKNRLPELLKDILVIMLYDNEPIIAYRTESGWCAPFPEIGDIVGDAYYDGSFTDSPNMGIEVTHWMPLPEPPIGQ